MEISNLFRNCGIFVVEISSGWVFIFLNSLLFFPIFSRNAAMSDWLKKKVLNIMTDICVAALWCSLWLYTCAFSRFAVFFLKLCNISIYARSYYALGVAQIKLLTYWLMPHIWMFFHVLDGCLQMVFAESGWFQFMPERCKSTGIDLKLVATSLSHLFMLLNLYIHCEEIELEAQTRSWTRAALNLLPLNSSRLIKANKMQMTTIRSATAKGALSKNMPVLFIWK